MTLKIELTTDWEADRMAEVWPSVLNCIRRFVEEFPDEASEQELIHDILKGARQLWVVYDEDQPSIALLAVLTARKTITSTGKDFIEILNIGGERIREALPLLSEIEAWAQHRGASESLVIGRFGWIPLLKERGYEKKAVILKKRLGDELNGQSDSKQPSG